MPKGKIKKTAKRKNATKKQTKKGAPGKTPKNNARKASNKRQNRKRATKTSIKKNNRKVSNKKKNAVKKQTIAKKNGKNITRKASISKKPTKKPQNKIQNKKSSTKILLNKTEQTPPENKESTSIKKNKTITRKKTAKLSPHILDLKKIQAAQNLSEQTEKEHAQIITSELFNKFNKQKKDFKKRLQSIYGRLRKKLTKSEQILKKDPKTYFKPIKKSYKINLPKIKLPKFNFSLPKLNPKEIRLGTFIIPSFWAKKILIFIVFCLFFILPFLSYDYYQNLQGKKNTILEKTSQALWHLAISQKAASAQDLYYTQLELKKASNNFSQAKNELESINLIIKNIINLTPEYKKEFEAAKKLVAIGEKLSKSAAILTASLDKIKIEKSIDSLNLTEKLTILKNDLNLMLPDLKSAASDLQKINLNKIPKPYQTKIKKLQIALPILEKNVANFVSSSDLILKLLGQESKKRYLLLFQNNNEIRPTGGFIGSFALVDIDKGNIKKINIPGGGPYDLKAGLKVNVESPKPLHLINPRWEFQDANWFADLPTSAEKLIWFYEKSGGPTVDGLIFINATFLEKILTIIEPIELPKYNKTISADNFFQTIQESVELEYDKKENKPKQIIADLTPKIINGLLKSDKKQFTEILDLILTSLNEKEIQFYFTNFILEKAVLKNNWGGRLKDTDKDYLNIVSTNIAGEKTDAKIKQTANLEVNIKNDGSITNTLNITKTHLGKKGENFYGVPNLDYLRIYVPQNSQLISASGFEKMPPELFTILHPEIYQKDPTIAFINKTKKIESESQTEIFKENGKTVFANWFKIEPGETKTVTLKYKPPFQLNLKKQNQQLDYLNLIKKELNLNSADDDLEKYSLLWQKQSGKHNFKINIKITLPPSLNYQIIFPDTLIKKSNTFTFEDFLNTDKLLAIIFRPN